ncbi:MULTISPECIES: SDR family oxidoreductase [Prochlorococcus]|uniref:NAD dependent epimerase/dehydratase n=1 Tax=Prochlorococcus marinus (strain SARG / CCMP1375 / SS120) TaxID=167539 RepID=Q7VC63_PROMA|nr:MULTISPECIES: SDR family oxidoreductase [Prochlorococcus]AAP99923.1 NAD dependent epimerase/dehydratase [Prochlorococcus marinus subsp. marinus str. CCMP1375]KGG11729.1 NAD dependent epimerase/dehydratase [Prochlorococcus marinus str. LG]KGG18857.1 NAD dependent epimerase/dehydratase [Prochlorococcus marinus str. SS2]KGG23605.1 NAD dependent epimerase/dehydratase [Prochlorococcus marinus str. SS35]KGG32159.1 NAD dependent epimerase/dehydratase [Prochlorococcus marinus str. SS51]
MKIAVSGASGKTGFRIAEEALKSNYTVSLITRKNSTIPSTLESCQINRLSGFNKEELDQALNAIDTLFIATGARPSIDLTGPAKIDACGVAQQVESCQRVGVKRIILVSSLCVGKLFHPLNLFGLILLWKKVGEQKLINSGIDWTIIRPGGLNETEDNLNKQSIKYTSSKRQEEGSIPRRLVAKSCIEALKTTSSIGNIIEITSNEENKRISMKEAIKGFNIVGN